MNGNIRIFNKSIVNNHGTQSTIVDAHVGTAYICFYYENRVIIHSYNG